MDKELYIKSMAKNYKKDESKIRSVYEVCERYGIEPYGNVFMRTAEDVERIILMLKGISLKPEMIKMAFRQNADSVEKIINICKENLIPVEPTLFYKDDVELKKIVEYVKKNFGSRYLKTHILTKDLDTIKQSMPFLQRLGLLPCVINRSTVLELTPDEIIDRTAIIKYLGKPIHRLGRYSKEDKLNPIYELSRKKYEDMLEENRISERVRKYQYDSLREYLFEQESSK